MKLFKSIDEKFKDIGFKKIKENNIWGYEWNGKESNNWCWQGFKEIYKFIDSF